MLSGVICIAAAESTAKIIFLRNPGVNSNLILFYRQTIESIFFLILLNKKAKNVLFESVPRRLIPVLFIRVIQGILTAYCVFKAVQNLPLVLVSLIGNTQPIVTAFLGFLILKERITIVQVLCLGIAFYGVYTIVIAEDEGVGANKEISFIPMLLLICVPVFLSIGYIC
jgi:drug/metabolite transporter (DMT)-like permease